MAGANTPKHEQALTYCPGLVQEEAYEGGWLGAADLFATRVSAGMVVYVTSPLVNVLNTVLRLPVVAVAVTGEPDVSELVTVAVVTVVVLPLIS